jgi:hypothetical protein
MSLAKYRKVSKGNGEYPNPTVPVDSNDKSHTEQETQKEDNGI